MAAVELVSALLRVAEVTLSPSRFDLTETVVLLI